MKTKSKLFLRIARPYVTRRLKRQFFDIRVSGLDRLRYLVSQGPVILACNHVAWWDPLVLVHLDKVLGSDGYCLMDKKSLQQLPFFRWVGALPVDRSSPKVAYRDLLAALDVLKKPGQIMAIFPQGEQRPAHLPLIHKPGVATLAQRSGAPVVPCALRYDFLESPRQIVHLKIGQALLPNDRAQNKEEFLELLADQMRRSLAEIDEELLAPNGAFHSLFGRKMLNSTSERIPFPAAALRSLTGSDAHD